MTYFTNPPKYLLAKISGHTVYSMIGFIEGIRLTYIPDELSNKRSVLCARHQGIVGDLQPLTEDMQ